MVARTTASALTAAFALAVVVTGSTDVTAQVTSSAVRGQNIAPVYEGWEKNPDGSFNLLFGYFNRNLGERIDIPVGPDNTIEPGGPDQGQPTHFYPRRSRFLFKIRVPADFGDKELVWTLTSNGQTEKAYASLLVDYFIDDTVIQNNKGAGGGAGGQYVLTGNVPPNLRLEGPRRREVAVGEPLEIAAIVTDDGMPRPRTLIEAFVAEGRERLLDDWLWPAAPPDDRWVSTATFDAPGTYILRAWADDGGLMSYDDITVVVTGSVAQQQ